MKSTLQLTTDKIWVLIKEQSIDDVLIKGSLKYDIVDNQLCIIIATIGTMSTVAYAISRRPDLEYDTNILSIHNNRLYDVIECSDSELCVRFRLPYRSGILSSIEYDKSSEKSPISDTFMQIAEVFSERSHAKRNKVGSVIVSKEGRILSTGYNGTPSGVDNICEDSNDKTYDYVIHSELNAIFNATTNDLKDCEMYVTVSPCIRCAAAIVQKKISKVYYRIAYRDLSGIEFLKRHGVEVEQI